MLETMAKNGSQDIVSWQPHGKAFRVHQPEVFANAIMPHYFNQTKYKSFQRQLHIYGFHRINKGMDKGAYFHHLFIQNKNTMSLRMVREKIKGPSAKKNHGPNEIEAPDFYKDMVVIESHPAYYNNYNDTPVPIMANFSRVVTAKNTNSCGVDGRLPLDSWLDMTGQKFSSSLFKKNNVPLFTGNVASVVAKENIEDGEEVFFQGKKFHFVETSVPTPAAEEDFLAFVTARGPTAYMPKCA
jgi:hypothetical protein